MIPSSSGRESEGQIATALSLSLLFPLSLFLSAFITSHFSFPLWHVSIYSPFVPPLQPLSLHIRLLPRPCISLSFAQSSSHSPVSFPIFILLSGILVGTQTHSRVMRAHRLTQLSYLPSLPQVITSQTHPHQHRISLAFKLTPRNAQRHINIYRLRYTSRPVEFDMLLRTRWV